MLRVDATAQEVKDSITGVPVTVHISAFLLGSKEVSQGEFEHIMGSNPSHYRGADRPVENLTWTEALDYCNRRSKAEGLSPCYEADETWNRACTGYRLPTDAEWTAATKGLTQESPAGANLYRAATSVKAIAERAEEGTGPVGASPQSPEHRFQNLFGNVWEFCWDRFTNLPIVDSVWNPAGPQTFDARVIRGGSFLTQADRWNKGFRASQPPMSRSPYTGFRVARSLPEESGAPVYEITGIEVIHSDDSPALPDTGTIRDTWMRVLGRPPLPKSAIEAQLVREYKEPAWSGRLLDLKLEGEMPWRSLLVIPAHAPNKPLPIVIVPYYDVDTPSGKNMGGRIATPSSVRAFAHLAAQFGMASLAVTWSGENDGPGYLEVVADLARRHPDVTGLGFWVWQARQIVNWLTTQPEIDSSRIGIMGHSLGGKMALYASAFDSRIRAVVSSEPGIAFKFTNYEDPWYFGERIELLPPNTDQNELLDLIAPRPFLLIAGEDSDGDKSIPVLRKAAPAYAAQGAPDELAILNHRSGHTPTPQAVVSAMAWLHQKLTQ